MGRDASNFLKCFAKAKTDLTPIVVSTTISENKFKNSLFLEKYTKYYILLF